MPRFLFLLLCLLLSACNLDGPPADATLAPLLPVVEILSPPNNQRVYAGTEFNFDIVARDATLGIARVDLWIDGTRINSAFPLDAPSVPVFRVEMNWLAQGVGKHLVEVLAFRVDGIGSAPAALNLEVIPRE